jgi:prepilin-type N-terminal cleavage/methylation domain-containing protein
VRDTRGFTLIELAVTIAILGILAAAAYGLSRSSYRNANLSSTVFEMSSLLSGLKASAISEQQDYLFVVVDASDADHCNALGTGCGQYLVLSAPTSSFSLASFNPSSVSNATFVDRGYFPRGVSLYTPSGAPPAPFGAVTYFPTDLTKSGPPKTFAIRFVRDGTVTGEPSGSATGPWPGFAFGLTGNVVAPDRKAVVVAFPSGVARTYSVQ